MQNLAFFGCKHICFCCKIGHFYMGIGFWSQPQVTIQKTAAFSNKMLVLVGFKQVTIWV